ncbi:MAG TPA: hypothetical protein P5567_01070 [Kiritimatiellia bacterium]|nr:hypothetical protein [Kiritimatiellia bacterium]HRZ11025.1 hypothetical protein [Kiritimatiellia bacterium]HSA18598.1 hypothetical protein [Kiritimatiellia bacterium]
MRLIKLDPEISRLVMSQNPAETTCRACGRYIGSWERCPFCRQFNPKRRIVRLLKYSTPFLTIAGIVLLSHMGRVYGSPTVKISSLGRKTNFAQVRVEGRISGDLRYYPADAKGRNSSLEFEVDDGTGLMRIRCYDDTTEELLKADKIPVFGDRVSLIGNYQYKARRQIMILSAVEDLDIVREKPGEATPIARVVRAFREGLEEGTRLKVTGRIQSRIPSSYDMVWLIEDEGGNRLAVNLSQDVVKARRAEQAGAQLEQMREGSFITCYGALQRYRSQKQSAWQLALAGPEDIQPADEAQWRADNAGP